MLNPPVTTHHTTPMAESPENKLITIRFFAFVGSNPDNRGGGSCLSLSVEREIIHRIAGCLISWVQIRTIWGGIKCVCKQFVKRRLFRTVRFRFRKSESSHRVDCFREDAKKPFSWVRVRTQHRKGQKESMKLRKNAGSKKREKSLEISRFLVFPRPDLNWLVIMPWQVNLDALQVTAFFRAFSYVTWD